jgi:transcription initiation factor TFIIE subunit alpha
MDIASTLIRSIARAFYGVDPSYIIIIDALIVHSTLRDDDLAILLGTQTKHLRKLCGRLREDGIISVHSRAELREGAQRPFNRDYYFINYHRAIDVVKFRMKVMTNMIEQKYSQTADEKKEYSCPQCKAEWTQMEVLDSMDDQYRFVCKTCYHLLNMRQEEINGAGHEVQSRLNAQLAPFELLMRQIDSAEIPENDFDAALANARPINRDESINPAARTEVVGRNTGLPPATVRGLKTGPEKVEITLMDDSQASKALELAAEAERKAKLAGQNQMPAWYTTSTVTGEHTGLGGPAAQIIGAAVGTLKSEGVDEDVKITGDGGSSALADYYKALAEEQKLQEKKDREDEDEFESEDDFEDVEISAASEEGPAKKVKIQEPEQQPLQAAPVTGSPADSDEDEDGGFEDVL